jgi:hypothetical protein
VENIQPYSVLVSSSLLILREYSTVVVGLSAAILTSLDAGILGLLHILEAQVL